MVLQNTCTGLEAFWDDFPPKKSVEICFKKIRVYYGSHTQNICCFGKSSQNSSKPVLIFWNVMPCVFIVTWGKAPPRCKAPHSSKYVKKYKHVVFPLIVMQSIAFEASNRSRSLPFALIHILASELSLAPIREIAR